MHWYAARHQDCINFCRVFYHIRKGFVMRILAFFENLSALCDLCGNPLPTPSKLWHNCVSPAVLVMPRNRF